MSRKTMFARGAAITALMALTAAPAVAGKADRARAAIAKAQAKIDVANKLDVGGAMPAAVARAQAELAHAREDLARGDKEQSISAAIRASQIADTAIGRAHQDQAAAMSAQAADADASVDAAHQAADAANQRAAAAEQRADMAQHQEVAATAEANALRNAPPATTTVTTVEKNTTATPVHHVTHRVVHHYRSPTRHRTTEKTTTTTVSTTPQ